MAQVIPRGPVRQTFDQRVVKRKNRLIMNHMQDTNVKWCGEYVPASLQFQYSPDDEFQKRPRKVLLHYLEEDIPNMRSGDPISRGSEHYTVKNGFPRPNGHCWMVAELKNEKPKRD